jgi:hypothetical protein
MGRCEAIGMPKIQKTLPLNESLCELIQEYADSLGTSFSKVLTAAVLDFFLEPAIKGQPPSSDWISAGAAVDTDRLQLADVVPTLFANYEKSASHILSTDSSLNAKDRRDLEERIKTYRIRQVKWIDDLKNLGGGQDALIEFLVRQLPSLARTKVPIDF